MEMLLEQPEYIWGFVVGATFTLGTFLLMNFSSGWDRVKWLIKRVMNPFYRFGIVTALFATKRRNFFNVLVHNLWTQSNRWYKGTWKCDGVNDIWMRQVTVWRNEDTGVCVNESWLRVLIADKQASNGARCYDNVFMDCTFFESIILKSVLILVRIKRIFEEEEAKTEKRDEYFKKLSGFEKL